MAPRQAKPSATEQNKNTETQHHGDPEIIEDGIPLDGPEDGRSQLTRLSLALMRTQPELSKIDGPDEEYAGRECLQAVIFGELTGLTGAKELPNAKIEEDKFTYGLVGNIEGVNARTGEMFKAAVLYLPAGFHDMFLAELESMIASQGKGGFTIQFALEFYSIPAKNPRGYSWKAKNKMPMAKRDPLEHLRRRALQGSTIKLLGATPAPGGGTQSPSKPVIIDG